MHIVTLLERAFGDVTRCIVVLTALAAARSTTAQTSIDTDPRNAAYWYERALERVDSIDDQQWNVLLEYESIDAEPSPELRATLRSMEPTLSLLRRGAGQEYSDQGLDFSKGWDLMLPHLSKLRQASRLLRAQSMVRMHDGDITGASRDLASMYRMGGHMGDDRILISALVGHAIFAYGDSVVQDAIDRGAIDSIAAAELARGVQQLDEHDPFGYIESIFSEHELMANSLQGLADDPLAAQQAIESLTGGDDPNVQAAVARVQAGGVDAEMRKLDETMNEVVEIFLLDDDDEARQRMQALEASIESGEAGVFAQLLMPAYGKVHERLIEAREMVADRRAMLEKLASGELDPNSLANAAILYRDAIEAYGQIEAEDRDRIGALAADPSVAIDENVAAALKEASPVIDQLRTASQLRRCDFKPLRAGNESDMLPAYVVGMRDLLLLVEAEIVARVRRSDAAGAADCITIGYRMIDHLGRDDALISALAAHDAFGDITAMARNGLASGLLNEQQALLRDAVQRIARRDPFGYINAVMETRKTVVEQLSRHGSAELGFDRDGVRELVQHWQGDELLFVQVVLITLEENSESAESADARSALERRLEPLDGIVSLAAVRAVQQGIGDSAPRLALGNVDLVSGLAIPSIGQWSQRMHRARVDLRAAYELFGVFDRSDDVDAEATGEDGAGPVSE